MADAGPGHPAQEAFDSAREWADRSRLAAEEGDDERARRCAEHARSCAAASREMLADRRRQTPYPAAADPRNAFAMDTPRRPEPEPPGDAWTAPPAPEFPEHVRAADALAAATGAGGRATFISREDGGQTVAGSPWPYRVEGGQVIYDRAPADHAEQIISAAASGTAARPWERHGLSDARERQVLDRDAAGRLEEESEQWAARLSGPQREWTTTYTGSSTIRDLNGHLYRGEDPDKPAGTMDVPAREVTGHLDGAIAAAGTSEKAQVGYRGYTPPAEVLQSDRVTEWARENFRVGGRYRDDSYMSVSHCPRVAASFADTYWKVEGGPSGRASTGLMFETLSRRGAPVAAVASYGNLERERLMPRGMNWTVVGVHEGVVIDGKPHMVVPLLDERESPRFRPK
ncbi:hypothetical protein [Streptomyces anulatus]|uniref:hypothetical protein n=1 Tax=Streptomyces anulatus TaxID=1892 RepID=UPI001C27282C|nr:hypothetical protein [Streptomyces anulatus]